METEICHYTCLYFCHWHIWAGTDTIGGHSHCKSVESFWEARSHLWGWQEAQNTAWQLLQEDTGFYCAQGKCWVLSSLAFRDTSDVCGFSQHWWKCPSCCVICAAGRWHLWLRLISRGCERYLPETEAEQSSQTSAQMPTSTSVRIFPCLYHPRSDDVVYDWQLETLPKKLLSVHFSSLPSSFPGPKRCCKTAS